MAGHGVYGCTFIPAPRCANGSVFKEVHGLPAVGKITIENTDDELHIGQALMGLPLADLYFALPTDECEPAQLPRAVTKDCPVITENPSAKLNMLIMPDGGKTMDDYMTDPERCMTNMKKILIHLLEGGIIYQDAGYVHNDIHPGNILVDKFNIARYIDFGLGFKIAEVKRWSDANLGRTFKAKYLWTAPEIHALRMIPSGYDLRKGVAELREHDEYRAIERWFVTDAETDLQRVVERTGQSDEALGTFLREHGKKIDCWRIGLLMLSLWREMLHVAPIQFKLSEVYKDKAVRDVIRGLTRFDPVDRWSFTHALRHLSPASPVLPLAAPIEPKAPVEANKPLIVA